jgi:hypothetical protein
MMKWLRDWFDGMIYRSWARANSPVESDTDRYLNIGASVKRRSGAQLTAALPHAGNHIHSPSVTFQIYSASGGTVLELRDYDPSMDRHYNALHVIPADQDLGQAIGHIITLEALKR